MRSRSTVRNLCRLMAMVVILLAPQWQADSNQWSVVGRSAWADDGDDGGGGGGGGGTSGGSADGGGPGGDRRATVQRGDAAVREVVASGLTAAHVALLRQRGFEVMAERSNPLYGGRVTLLRAPLTAVFRDPVQEVRALGAGVTADRNHYYRSNQAEAGRALMKLAAWPVAATRCSGAASIGLIDTGVDTSHPALRGASILVVALPDDGARKAADRSHGTALAALLVGRSPDLPALAPGARLVSVDAFQRGVLGDERMEVWDLLAALNAVVASGTRVINMSFAGGANALLEKALARLHQRGIVAVAAVGNQGPQAEPQYPAAYATVLAVTAVGGDQRVYHRAGRGQHVDFAAPGVDVPTAEAGGARGSRSGTSFATPFVTAAAAMALRQRALSPAGVERLLAGTARDLGTPGRDDTFGHGLLQLGRLCGSASASALE